MKHEPWHDAIHCLEIGKGTTLVILPGNWTTSWSFRSIAKKLASHFHILVPDLFRGDTKFSQPAFFIQDYANALHHFLMEKQIQKVMLIGTSFGGLIASEFALRYPEQVNKLLLINTLPPAAGVRFGVRRSLQAYLLVFLRNLNSKKNVAALWRSIQDLVRNCLWKHPHQFILDGFAAISATGGLARPFAIPTKLLLASQDEFIPIDLLPAQTLKRYEHEIIQGDHMWFFTDEDLLVHKIREFSREN